MPVRLGLSATHRNELIDFYHKGHRDHGGKTKINYSVFFVFSVVKFQPTWAAFVVAVISSFGGSVIIHHGTCTFSTTMVDHYARELGYHATDGCGKDRQENCRSDR